MEPYLYYVRCDEEFDDYYELNPWGSNQWHSIKYGSLQGLAKKEHCDVFVASNYPIEVKYDGPHLLRASLRVRSEEPSVSTMHFEPRRYSNGQLANSANIKIQYEEGTIKSGNYFRQHLFGQGKIEYANTVIEGYFTACETRVWGTIRDIKTGASFTGRIDSMRPTGHGWWSLPDGQKMYDDETHFVFDLP